jgi:hypothetical protein
LSASQPSGIDITHSEVSYQEHLEFVVGKTTEETLAHFDSELAWFIARMNEATSEEVYFRYKHGYNQLIEIYQVEHHINLSGHITTCPAYRK